MKRRRKLKRKKYKPPFYILISLIIGLLLLTHLENIGLFKINYIESIELENNEFKIHLKDKSNLSCIVTNEDKQISVYTHITSAEGEKRVSAGNIAIPAGDIVQRQFSVNGISSYGENADFTTFFWMDETPCTYKVQK